MKLLQNWQRICGKIDLILPPTCLKFVYKIPGASGHGQRGGNNHKVQKPDCKSFLAYCLLPPAFCLLALGSQMRLIAAEAKVSIWGIDPEIRSQVRSNPISDIQKISPRPRVPASPRPRVSLNQLLITTPLAQSLPSLKPTQPAALEKLNQGLALIQEGKLADAIAAFREATQLNPQLAPAHYNLGLALRQTGELQAAADAFYQATQADPDFALAFANLGAALLEGNNLEQAQAYLSKAIELDPNLGVAYYNYGLVLSEQGKLENAIAAFQQAMQLSQNAPEPAYHLGMIYWQQGEIEAAKKLLQRAIKISPQYPEAHYTLGSIFFAEGNLDAALAEFRSAAQSNSNYANAYYGAGLVFLRQERFSDAQQVLEYARDLYKAQGITEWADNAEQLLEQAQNSNPQ